ncbi:MAG: hypothetical protein WBV94_02350 [Blastocatellia bacterium]
MDPISLEMLLSVCDGIEKDRSGNDLSRESFEQIIKLHSQALDLERRVRDISRVLQSMNLLTSTGEDFYITSVFQDLIAAWNGADFIIMNQCLAGYSPYRSFLNFLQKEKAIKILPRGDKIAKQNLNRWLQQEYKITFVAFDTFRFWATALGQAYLSPFTKTIYWGGAWDKSSPSLEELYSTFISCYELTDRISGYANIGRIAEDVCIQMQISFQAFELKLNELMQAYPSRLTFATVTRRQLSSHITIPILRPRHEVIRERVRVEMLQSKTKSKPRWIAHRYLEEGIHIGSQLVRLVKREDNYDTQNRSKAV